MLVCCSTVEAAVACGSRHQHDCCPIAFHKNSGFRLQRTALSSRFAVHRMDNVSRDHVQVHVPLLRGGPPVAAVVPELLLVPALVPADLGRRREHPAPLGRAEVGGVRDRLDRGCGGERHPSRFRRRDDIVVGRGGAGAGVVGFEGRAAGNAHEAGGQHRDHDVLPEGVEEPLLRLGRQLRLVAAGLPVVVTLEGLGRRVVSGEKLIVRGRHGDHH